MRTTVIFFAILILCGTTLVGCATMSEEERCRREGGVWNNKICERPK